MSKKKDDVSARKANYAFLVAPAKDLVENFSIDVLKALTGYLEAIQRAEDGVDGDTTEILECFDFVGASRILEGSTNVYGKKVDHVHKLTMSVLDLIENRTDGVDGAKPRKGARGKRTVNLGSTDYGLIDVKELKRNACAGYEKAVKEEKKLIDALRIVDNAEIAEAEYERTSCLIEKPTQFMFNLEHGQIQRADEQVLNAKSRPEVIGKVKDFNLKTSDVLHEHQLLIAHDDFKKNVDQFTLPGARWIPDNKELARDFGVAEIEAELDNEQQWEFINPYGPFEDPFTNRKIVDPPHWFMDQEATRQNLELQSRATSRATMGRDSRAYGSQGLSQRQSHPSAAGMDLNLSKLLSSAEEHMAKNRPSTHLNTGLVDMLMDSFGPDYSYQNPNDEYEGGGAADDVSLDENGNSNDYVRNVRRGGVSRKKTNPWDDLEPVHVPLYTGDEDIPVNRKPLKVITKLPLKPSIILKRKQAREAKIPKSRRDEFMETHDYLQDCYYWRSAARINPNKDWKVEALRTAILTEKKRKCREKTNKIRELRAKESERKRSILEGIGRRTIPAGIDEMDDDDDTSAADQNRRMIGELYGEIDDNDLAEEVETSELGGNGADHDLDAFVGGDPEYDPLPRPDYEYDDVPPIDRTSEVQNAPEEQNRVLMFEDIDDAELNNVINLSGSLFVEKAVPLLKKFVSQKTDREQVAYEMAKAYAEVDVAVSNLQDQVDKWHLKMEPILDEGETRKEYDVHKVGQELIDTFSDLGETKRIVDLCLERPWYEVSRYFLSCLFMCNTGNLRVENDASLSLEDRINSMSITLLDRKMHVEKMDDLNLEQNK